MTSCASGVDMTPEHKNRAINIFGRVMMLMKYDLSEENSSEILDAFEEFVSGIEQAVGIEGRRGEE
jgi:hypothetical protein